MLGRVRVSLTSDFKSACFHQHSLLDATAYTHLLSRPWGEAAGREGLSVSHCLPFLFVSVSNFEFYHLAIPQHFPQVQISFCFPLQVSKLFLFFKAMKSDPGEFMFFWAPLPLIIFSFFSLLSYLTPVINTCFTSSCLTSLNASPFLETDLSLCRMYNFLHHDF